MDQLSIKVRARTAKEAVNLGFIVARKYFFQLFLAVFPMWFFAVAVAAVLWWLTKSPSLAILIVWWLKPLYERAAVKRLSRLIFSQEDVSTSDQKAVFAKGLLMELTFLRLFRGNAINRHAVNILEGVSGAAKRERLRFVRRGGVSGKVIVVLSLLETLFVYTVVLLIPSLPEIPWHLLLLNDYLAFEESAYWFLSLLAVLYMIASVLSTVFFVAIGFMSYINHRIISEGWAIALDLQTLATRLGAFVCALLLALSFCVYSPPAVAISDTVRQQDKETIEQLVNDPKIGPYQIREKREYKDRELFDDIDSGWDVGFAEWMKFIFIAVVVIAVVWVIFTVVNRQRWSVARVKSSHIPDKVALSRGGVGFTASSMDKAWEYLQSGQLIAAMAVLYGRLVAEPKQHRIPSFIAGESETEYLARGESVMEGRCYDFIRAFFVQWQLAVYGHETLSQEVVRGLLEQYQSLYPVANTRAVK